MRVRLRPAWSPERLAEIYAVPHSHERWPDHRLRVAETIKLGIDLMNLAGHPEVIADLSCGDAAIPQALIWYDNQPAKRLILGDFAPGYEITGPLEQTLDQLAQVGLFVCSETIEHLDDPDAVLRKIRSKAAMLLLSTPLGEFHSSNMEHYWGWDEEGVREMLEAAGWSVLLQHNVIYPGEGGWVPAAYQVWGCG